MMYPEVRYFYCLGCDPDQPKYTNDTGHVAICKSFLDRLWRDPAYDECGVMYPNPCPDSSWDFDPYMCGDTLKLPKQDYDNVTMFINDFKPPGLEDYTFVAVDDTIVDGVPVDPRPCWTAQTYKVNSAAPARVGALAGRDRRLARRHRRRRAATPIGLYLKT